MGEFDHQIQDRGEQERVMERDSDERQVGADEVTRSVTSRRMKCDCRRWKGEGRDEDGTGLKRWQRSDMEVIRTYRIVEALIVMEGS